MSYSQILSVRELRRTVALIHPDHSFLTTWTIDPVLVLTFSGIRAPEAVAVGKAISRKGDADRGKNHPVEIPKSGNT